MHMDIFTHLRYSLVMFDHVSQGRIHVLPFVVVGVLTAGLEPNDLGMTGI
jgi:hypothetical protein